MTVAQQFATIPIGQLRLTENVRREPGDLTDLVDSIRQHGVLEAITVCPTEDREAFDILFGQRRFLAAKELGLMEMPCRLRKQRPSERERLLIQLAENFDRADMSPIDEALAFKELLRHGLTQAAIAKAVHRNQTTVSKTLRLLEFPQVIRLALDLGYVDMHIPFEIPRRLLEDRKALKRLALVIRQGNAAVRTWILDESRQQSEAARQREQSTVTRTIGVSLDAYDDALQGAKQAKVPMGQWVGRAIRHERERQASE